MADFDDLLTRTSRTFAVAVPLLPEPLRRQVVLAYLLFRTADTLEDADRWPLPLRVAALSDLARVPHGPGDARRLSNEWTADPPVTHAGYLDLLAAFPDLAGAVERLPDPARDIIWCHWRRTVGGMIAVLERADPDGAVRLTGLDQLRSYCYTVAGIVGEMLTELFVLHAPGLAPARPALCRLAPAFGEGLQLVNVLKDAGKDAAEQRFYLPPDLDRAALIELARAGLGGARRYVDLLRLNAAPSGVIGFTALPVLLADAALDAIAANGSGAKVSRVQVGQISDHLLHALGGSRPLWNGTGVGR